MTTSSKDQRPKIPSDRDVPPQSSTKELVVRGLPASMGIVEGTLFDIRVVDERPTDAGPVSPEQEKARFLHAVERLLEKIRQSQRYLSPELRGFLVFEEGVLQDSRFRDQVLRFIEAGIPASRAIEMVMEEIAQPMEQAGVPLFQDRARELRALARVLRQEARFGPSQPLDTRDGNILVSDHLSVQEAIEVTRNGFQGVVLTRGGKTSHPVLLLRDFRIPVLIQADDLPRRILTGTPAILDTRRGIVVLNPSPQTREQYGVLIQSWKNREKALRSLKEEETLTRDGLAVHLMANVELPEEIPLIKDLGIRGIGLLRTEMLFHTHQGVDEQESFYRSVGKDLSPHPVTIRLFDLGGDKVLNIPHEPNPFLGLRGIRVLLQAPHLLESQVRAILRAHRDTGNLRIMIPMVTSLEEILAVQEVIERVRKEEGLTLSDVPPLGAMIETPSAALLAEVLAQHVAFFSIGTNDLTQYVLAMDRTHPILQKDFHHLHPAIIRLLWFVIRRAHKSRIWIGICGEMASDLEALPLLVALRVEELSMSPSVYLDAKSLIHEMETEVVRGVLEKALAAETLEEVRLAVLNFYREHLPKISNILWIAEEEEDGV